MGKKLTKEEFIEKSKIIHDNKYDYSLVNYKNNKTNVKIICLKHGIFEQTPDRHFRSKYGCPSCYGNKKMTTEELKHDDIKTNFCKDSNIKLIRIKYNRKLNSDYILEKILS